MNVQHPANNTTLTQTQINSNRCGAIFDDWFVTQSLLSPTVKEF